MHRLFQQTSPCDDFVQWVNRNMPEIAKYVDGNYSAFIEIAFCYFNNFFSFLHCFNLVIGPLYLWTAFKFFCLVAFCKYRLHSFIRTSKVQVQTGC